MQFSGQPALCLGAQAMYDSQLTASLSKLVMSQLSCPAGEDCTAWARMQRSHQYLRLLRTALRLRRPFLYHREHSVFGCMHRYTAQQPEQCRMWDGGGAAVLLLLIMGLMGPQEGRRHPQ